MIDNQQQNNKTRTTYRHNIYIFIFFQENQTLWNVTGENHSQEIEMMILDFDRKK